MPSDPFGHFCTPFVLAFLLIVFCGLTNDYSFKDFLQLLSCTVRKLDMLGSLHPSEPWTNGWWGRAMKGQLSDLRSRELWGEATLHTLSEITTYSPLLLHCFLHFLSTSLGSTSLVNYLHMNCHFSISLKGTRPKTAVQIKNGWSGRGNTARGDHRHNTPSTASSWELELKSIWVQELLSATAAPWLLSCVWVCVCISFRIFPSPLIADSLLKLQAALPKDTGQKCKTGHLGAHFHQGCTHTHTHAKFVSVLKCTNALSWRGTEDWYRYTGILL